MPLNVTAMAEVDADRQARIVFLSDVIVQALHSRCPNGGSGLKLSALLDAYFSVANAYGVVPGAIAFARLNADGIEAAQVYRPADGAVH